MLVWSFVREAEAAPSCGALHPLRPLSGDEVVVPAGHEIEDGLHSQRGLHDRKHDLIEGVELSGTVDAGRFHDLHRQAGVKVLLHEEEDGRRCDAGDDEREERVLPSPAMYSPSPPPARPWKSQWSWDKVLIVKTPGQRDEHLWPGVLFALSYQRVIFFSNLAVYASFSSRPLIP